MGKRGGRNPERMIGRRATLSRVSRRRIVVPRVPLRLRLHSFPSPPFLFPSLILFSPARLFRRRAPGHVRGRSRGRRGWGRGGRGGRRCRGEGPGGTQGPQEADSAQGRSCQGESGDEICPSATPRHGLTFNSRVFAAHFPGARPDRGLTPLRSVGGHRIRGEEELLSSFCVGGPPASYRAAWGCASMLSPLAPRLVTLPSPSAFFCCGPLFCHAIGGCRGGLPVRR